MPGLFVLFVASLFLLWLLDWLAGRFGLYRLVWHPPLFRLSLFVCVFGVLALFLF